MGDDTAAAISAVGIPPARWEHVTFQPGANGAPWKMTVEFTGRNIYPRTVYIPGGSAAQEVLKMLSDPTGVGVKDLAAWQQWIRNERDYDVTGSGTVV